MAAMRLPSGLAVLQERDYRAVFSAQAVSLLGDGIVPVALAFAVLDLTGSASDLGIVLAARMASMVGCLLAGGVIADRTSRRAVMIAADVIRLLCQGLLGFLLVSGHARLWEVVASQVVLGGASGFFNPASSGLIPMVVSPARLQDANALRGVVVATGAIAGPAIAGILVVSVGSGEALLIDAASYALSAALLARVRVDGRVTSPASGSFVGDLRRGWTEFRTRTWVWAFIAVISLTNALSAAFIVLGPLVAKLELGGAGAWAVILACRGVGALLGGVITLRIRPARPLLIATLACEFAVAPTLLLAAHAPVATIAAAALLAGGGPMVLNVLWETTLQQHIPPVALSRVSAYDWFGSLALQPFGMAIVGPIAAHLGVTTTLYLAGGLELAALTGLLLIRDIRRIGPADTSHNPRPTRADIVTDRL